MSPRPDMPAVAALLAQHIETLAIELAGTRPTGRHRDELRFRARGSLAVVIAGPKRGSWHDHEAGEGGDALAMIAHFHRSSMGAAWRWALAWLGLDASGSPPPPPRQPAEAPPEPPREPVPSPTLPLARQLWREAVAPGGTLVETYLRHRGLALPGDAPLRFHPACPRGLEQLPDGRRRVAERLPAVLALMTDPITAEPCGVHRTFLAPDGRGKAAPGPNGEPAKMMAGQAGVVRLVPDEAVEQGLGLAEGVETALAVMQHAGWSPVWAATSTSGIVRFPALPGIETLTLFTDADDRGAGLKAARKCAEAWAGATEVRIITPPPGQDFHDALAGAA